MEGRLDEFKAVLQVLIERKVAPLEQEIKDQAEQIQRLTDQIAALTTAKSALRRPEEAKRPRSPPKTQEEEGKKTKEEAKRPKDDGAAQAKKARDEAAAEAKRVKAEELRQKTEEAKKKTEEEKTRKLETKKAQDEAAKKKLEEAKAAKEKARLEAEEKKKEVEGKRSEEKKKKEVAGKGKADPSKKPSEEGKKAGKKQGKSGEKKEEEKAENEGQIPPPQEQSLESNPECKELSAAEAAQPPTSRLATEESERLPQAPSEALLLTEEPIETVEIGEGSEGKAMVEQPAFVEEEAQPSAPESKAEDHTQELERIEEELRRLRDVGGKQSTGEADLLRNPPFQLSLGAKSAMSLLNTLDEAQLYLHSEPPRDETMWVFRLFFQLRGETLPDDRAAAWELCRLFLAAGQESSMEKKVQEAANSFDFSDENIDKVEKTLAGRVDKVNPNIYNQFCTLTGLIMFTVKEGVTYSGLLPEKAAPWRRYQRLLHRKQLLS